MDTDTLTASFSENDIINALDLDRDNIQYIDVHHDYGEGLVVELKLSPKPTPNSPPEPIAYKLCIICHPES